MELQDHPMVYAEWDSTNPLASFQQFANFIHDNSKKYLLEDKTHAEMMFFMPLGGKGTLVTIQCTADNSERDSLAQWVRGYITKNYIYGVVHVCESWVKFADGANDIPLSRFRPGK